MVQRKRIDGDAGGLALFDEIFRGLDVKAGKMQLAAAIGIAEFLRAHMRAPAREHGDAGVFRDLAIGGDPGLEIVGRHLRVCVAGCLFADIDDAKRHDELLHRQFGDGKAVGGKVQGRVDMGARMFVHPQFEQVELVLGVVELLFAEELLLAEEGREILMQFMGEIGDACMSLRQGRGAMPVLAAARPAVPTAAALKKLRRESMRSFTVSITQASHIVLAPFKKLKKPAGETARKKRPAVAG